MAHRQDWSRRMAQKGYQLSQPTSASGGALSRAPISGQPVVPDKAVGSTRFLEAHVKAVKPPRLQRGAPKALPASIASSGAVYQAFLPCRDVLLEKVCKPCASSVTRSSLFIDVLTAGMGYDFQFPAQTTFSILSS